MEGNIFLEASYRNEIVDRLFRTVAVSLSTCSPAASPLPDGRRLPRTRSALSFSFVSMSLSEVLPLFDDIIESSCRFRAPWQGGSPRPG